MRLRLVVALGMVFLTLSAEAAYAVNFNFSGALTAGDPTQTGRLRRDPPPSECADESTNPGIQSGTTTSTFAYDAHTFVNGPTASCVTVTVETMNCVAGTLAIFPAAYLGSFNPAAVATGWLADPGASPNPIISFSFDLGASEKVIIVVSEVTSGAGCPGYSGTISDLSTGATTPVTLRSFTASRARASTGVLLRWRTASEYRTLGYNVYRQVGSKRVKLNRSLVPSAFGGSPQGRSYTWLDRAAARRAGVRYWLQEVSLDGKRSWVASARARSVGL